MATYRWYTLPRVRLAILWAGIEGLFGASSEIRFRISLYIARYLFPADPKLRKQLFDEVMKFYNVRSAAVHGSKIKGDATAAVAKLAEILSKLIRQCAVERSMPDETDLYPYIAFRFSIHGLPRNEKMLVATPDLMADEPVEPTKPIRSPWRTCAAGRPTDSK